jgi:HD-GYP domain-containing protein (c-di-GMP phosphodiesterase class II)
MGSGTGPTEVRLAELVAALSLGVDLGFDQPMEHVLRECLIALRLAERVGLDEDERLVVYYTGLLVNVGCHSDAHEQAKWFGDDIALKSTKYRYEIGSARGAAATMRMLGSGNPPLHRFRVGLEFIISGRHEVDDMITQHARLAGELAERLRLPVDVQQAVAGTYEQWDGKGFPGTMAGEAIPIAARLAVLAEFVEAAHRLGGVEAARAVAERRAGTQFDPELAAVLCRDADLVLADLDTTSTWDAVIGAEPSLGIRLSDAEFEAALRAVADFVDLKSPYFLGHAGAVAELADAAGERLGLPAPERSTLRRAALVHGFGRLGVSNAIWDKPGALGAGEWERVRLYPHLTERMLQQSPALAPLGAVAVQVRERLDGSGYPRGLSGAAISTPGRVLAAAEAYQTKREPRPHRIACTDAVAAAELRAEVRAGLLDGDVVEAVLAAAGHRTRRRREGPAGLTAREIEVLRLVALGLSSKEIARRLTISPKTARNHIEHIYTKIGATNRVSASLFAVQQGLLPDDDLAD